MLFTPTALILADTAQQNLLNAGRLDGRSTGVTSGPATRRVVTTQPVRRSLRGLVLRTRPAV